MPMAADGRRQTHEDIELLKLTRAGDSQQARDGAFTDIVTIDDDLGRSASGFVARPGFDALVAQLCKGAAGAVFCLEASRLVRNDRDWHHALELCGLVRARVIDPNGVHDPSVPNDRLLLGLKGTMSDECELMRRRLVDRFESARQVLLHIVRDGVCFPRPADRKHQGQWQ